MPWNSYYFHSCFSASFQFFYHTTRKLLDRRDLAKWERGTLTSELASIVVAALMGMPGGCLLFIPLYHPLHDFYGVPSEITSITVLLVFASIVWKFDRKSNRGAAGSPPPAKIDDWLSKALIVHLVCHYALNLGTAIFVRPEEVVSIGVHEPIGDCDERVPVETVLLTLSKRKYLCVDDYDEKYYDFHCLPDGKPPSAGSRWYTICGTPHEYESEMLHIVCIPKYVHNRFFPSLFLQQLRGIRCSHDADLLYCLHGVQFIALRSRHRSATLRPDRECEKETAQKQNTLIASMDTDYTKRNKLTLFEKNTQNYSHDNHRCTGSTTDPNPLAMVRRHLNIVALPFAWLAPAQFLLKLHQLQAVALLLRLAFVSRGLLGLLPSLLHLLRTALVARQRLAGPHSIAARVRLARLARTRDFHLFRARLCVRTVTRMARGQTSMAARELRMNRERAILCVW